MYVFPPSPLLDIFTFSIGCFFLSLSTSYMFSRAFHVSMQVLGSINSRCSGNEPALLARRFFLARNLNQTRKNGGKSRCMLSHVLYSSHCSCTSPYITFFNVSHFLLAKKIFCCLISPHPLPDSAFPIA